jgi:hypothetical protein
MSEDGSAKATTASRMCSTWNGEEDEEKEGGGPERGMEAREGEGDLPGPDGEGREAEVRVDFSGMVNYTEGGFTRNGTMSKWTCSAEERQGQLRAQGERERGARAYLERPACLKRVAAKVSRHEEDVLDGSLDEGDGRGGASIVGLLRGIGFVRS